MLAKRLRLMFLFLVALVLTVWPHPQPLTVYYPQFLLVSFIIAAFFNPHIKWVALVCVFGLVVDFMTMTVLGWHALLYCMPVWMVCYWRNHLNINSLSQLLIVVGALLLLTQLWALLLGFIFTLPALSQHLWLSWPASLVWASLLWYSLGVAGFTASMQYK